MIKVLFICHGNICRSPMAEFVMKDMVRRAGLEDEFQIASAATSSEEIGSPVYPPARRKLWEHGIRCDGKTARRIRAADYEDYDLLIGMDEANMRNMARCFGGDGRESCVCCCASRGGRTRWPTPGTPGILRPPGRM